MSKRRVGGLTRILSVDTSPDRELLRRYLADRDEAAFAELVNRHSRLVRAAAERVLVDPADVDDATQAAFLVLLRRSREVDWRAELGPWLYGVTHRIAVRLRSQVRPAPLPEHVASPPAPDPSWREACDALHAELDRLPTRYRLPLLLCYLEGQTRDEAAAALGVSVGTVKGRVQRGLRMLERRLARRGIGLSAGLLAAVARPGSAAPTTTAELVANLLNRRSPRSVQLAKGVTMKTSLAKPLGVVAVVVGACALAWAAGAPTPPPVAEKVERAAAVQPPPAVKPVRVFTLDDDDGVWGVAFSRDGKTLFTGGTSVAGQTKGSVRFRDPKTGKPTNTLVLPTGVETLALSPDDKWLAVGTGGALQGPPNRPFRVERGTFVLMAQGGGAIKKSFELQTGSLDCRAAAFSADNTLLATGGTPPDLKGVRRALSPIVIWDVATAKEKVKLAGQPGYVRGLAFSPDGTKLAAASYVPGDRPRAAGTGHLHLWDVATGKSAIELKGGGKPAWCVAYSPDGKTLAAGADGQVRLWDAADGKELAALAVGAPVAVSVAYSPDGRLLATGGGNPGDAETPGTLKVWDVAARKELAALPGHGRTVVALAFAADGARLAVGEMGGAVTVWDVFGK